MDKWLVIIIFLFCVSSSFGETPAPVLKAVSRFEKSLSEKSQTPLSFKLLSYTKTELSSFYFISVEAFNKDGIKLSDMDFISDGNWVLIGNVINLTTGFDEAYFWKACSSPFDMSKVSLTDNRIIYGKPSNPVKVIIFSDFFCPACYELSQYLPPIAKKYEGKVVFYFKHSPFSDTPEALETAKIYEACRIKGYNLYSRYFRLIRTCIGAKGKVVPSYLRDKVKKWYSLSNKDLKISSPVIKEDYLDARKLHAEKISPAVFVGNLFYPGCSKETLEEIIKRILID